MKRLSPHEQKTLLFSIIRILSEMHLSTDGPTQDLRRVGQSKAIGGVAALIRAIVEDDQVLQDFLVEWLVGVFADAVGYVHIAHRAVTAALSSIAGEYLISPTIFIPLNRLPEQATKALQKGLALFGDKIYIKHTPILHQEGRASNSLFLPYIVVAKQR